ncbi:hypothetical protein KP509_37G047500 [Ceratopteris richardii]|uniref:Uncharacterized protein n=1 Tax=Ceratopteris richardii TaxID=49495 RepID=A0A8T2Q8M2_CERRI|nr:hypothetical protein KP509_37G047500 [Ceratopteris richardii]
MGLMEAAFFEDLKGEHRKDSGLTREDIESLTVDENLTDLQRAQLFLSTSAHQLQQSCAFERLPSIFADYGTDAYEALFPTISSSIEHFSPHIQVLAGKTFATVIEIPNAPKEVATWLLPMVLRMINSVQLLEVLHTWIDLLCLLVPKLSLQVVKEDLIQLALTRGKVEEAVTSRVICSRLLGAIAPMLESQEIEQLFLDKAMGLCQDTDTEVRISMCNQLNAISRAVGIEITKKLVLPELYELLKDEEVAVHCAALTCLIDMLDFLPSDVKRLKILPILRLACNQDDAKMLLPICRIFGELMLKMAPDLSEEEIQLFVDSYKSLCRHPSEELCAYNFPAILKAIGPRKYVMTLHLTYQQLVQDPSSQTRCSISSSFHEVSKLLGKERTATYLKESFLFLLTNSSRDVQQKLTRHLQHIIGQFAVSNEEMRVSIYTSILPYLLQAEKDVTSSNLWRLQTSLFETFSQLIEYVSSDLIFEYLVPLCFYHMTESVLPVRSAAANALAIFTRNNRRALQRYELCQRVVRDFAHGRSYTARLVFIDFCESFISISSSHMFKEHFLDAALAAIQDEVIDVRMRACVLLPLLKGVVKLPDDAASLEKINFLASQRLNDNDKQVAAAAKAVSDTFKHISVRCLGVEPGNENYALQMETEAIDKQREEDEWNMLCKEEQEEQRKLDEMIQKMKMDGNKKSLLFGGAGYVWGPGEKAASFATSRSPAIARFKSTVASLNMGISSSFARQGGATTGAGVMLSRSPTIFRAQGNFMSSGSGKSGNMQQSSVTAPSSFMRSTPGGTSMSATPQGRSSALSSSTESANDTSPVRSSSNGLSSKGNIRNNTRTARKSS